MVKRKKIRVSISLPVVVEEPLLEVRLQGKIRDISATGLLLSLTEPLARGGHYRLLFSFPGVKVPIQTEATCVRSIEEWTSSQGTPEYLAALGFSRMESSVAQDLEVAIRDVSANITDFLNDHEPFSALDEELLLQIAGNLQVMRLGDGETCPVDWDMAGSLIMVRSGVVKFFRPGYRQGKEMAQIGTRGHVLGEQALLEGQSHGLRIRALATSEVLIMSAKAYAALQKEYPRAGKKLKSILKKIDARRQENMLGAFLPLGLSIAMPSL